MTFNDNVRVDTSKVQRRTGGSGGGGRGGLKIAGGGLVGVIVLFVVGQLLGVNLLGSGGIGGLGSLGTVSDQSTQSVTTDNLDECQTGEAANVDDVCRMTAASDSIDRYWATQVGNYRAPGVVLYDGSTQSGCGPATADVGPFYCPADESIYVDTAFFQTLRTDFGASGGSLAQMYVLAHEWGHHISNLIGSMNLAGRDSGPTSGSVRLELQADCFAGAWTRSASTVSDDSGVPFLKPVTTEQIADALNAAAAVGDDSIQQRSTGRINPEGFTHGTSEQRQRWFQTGYDQGPTACATFDVDGSEL